MLFPRISLPALLFLGAGLAAEASTVGNVFYFTPDVGACGYNNTGSDPVGTVSSTTFKSFPNPICQHNLTITAGNVTISVFIRDYFPEDKNAKKNDVGIPEFEFVKFAPLDDGIVENASWGIV
ncbi:unnamed protein product [Mycena citricolor]|uniref:Uncharacterized protein n=1 Tax=Mycena citricolor TaxID=2018698 RepID=A0AAD2Q1T4_9AGAR|nr:unnamed protein product [Mycena citricolor]